MLVVVLSSKVVKAMAKLHPLSALFFFPQVGLLNWSAVHHYWKAGWYLVGIESSFLFLVCCSWSVPSWGSLGSVGNLSLSKL